MLGERIAGQMVKASDNLEKQIRILWRFLMGCNEGGKKKLRIAFAWQTLTSDNLGIGGALAQSQLTIAKKAASALDIDLEAMEFCPISPQVELAKNMGFELADPLSPKGILLGKSKYVSQLRSCDIVLDIGAGDSFSDIYMAQNISCSFVAPNCLPSG